MARRALAVLCAAGVLAGCSLFAESPEPQVAIQKVPPRATAVPPRPAQPERPERPALPQGPAPEPRSLRGNPVQYTQNGRTYRVMDSAQGYRERGIASWYGPKFHGRPTSNGETFDMHGISAAHKTLPLPTWVEVTDVRTGRSITVRVNDRGPFHARRIIDLSYGAAQALGMVRRGVAEVEVRTLAGPVDADPYLQLGAFRERSNAMRFLRRVRSRGIDSVTMHPHPKRAMNIVVHGPVPRSSLPSARDTLRRAGIPDPTLIFLP